MQLLSSSVLALVLALATVNAHVLPRDVSSGGRAPVGRSITARNPNVNTPTIFKRQTTTDACVSECSGDTATINALDACDDDTDVNTSAECVCQAVAQLSSTCQSCILNEDGLTAADWAQTCATASSDAAGATAVFSGVSPYVTASPGLDACSSSSCTSSSDLAALNEIAPCNAGDLVCVCAATFVMSSTCESCVLAAFDVTQAQLAEVCSDGEPINGSPTATAPSPAGTTSAAGNNNSGSGATPGGASAASSPSASAAHSGAGRVMVGRKSVVAAGAFVLVGGLMVLL